MRIEVGVHDPPPKALNLAAEPFAQSIRGAGRGF